VQAAWTILGNPANRNLYDEERRCLADQKSRDEQELERISEAEKRRQEEAEKRAGEAEKRHRESGPGNAARQHGLFVAFAELIKLGEVAAAQGNLPEAQRLFADSLRMVQRLAESDPGDADWQRNLWLSHSRTAQVLDKQRDARAKDHWRKAHDILEAMVHAGLHVSPQDLDFLQHLRGRIGREEAENRAAEAEKRHREDELKRPKQEPAAAKGNSRSVLRLLEIVFVLVFPPYAAYCIVNASVLLHDRTHPFAPCAKPTDIYPPWSLFVFYTLIAFVMMLGSFSPDYSLIPKQKPPSSV
jgi:hypothetical protein